MIQRTKIHGDIFPIPDDKAMAPMETAAAAMCRQQAASCSSSSSSRRCLNGINFVQNKSIMVGHAKRGETGDDLSHLFCDKRAVSNPGFSSLHT